MARDRLQTQQPNLLYPGLIVILLVAIARFLGGLQFFELKALDVFLRLRPAEPMDERITIVEVTEEDITKTGTYPIPDTVIAEALDRVQQHSPRAIGLDIFRDFPVYGLPTSAGKVDITGYSKLIETIKSSENIFVIDKILPPGIIAPPVGIPLEQVGFADAKLDQDGFVRRSLLGSPDLNSQYRLSLTILLAQEYLSYEGFSLGNSQRDPIAMRFGDVELSSAHSTSQSYVTKGVNNNPIVLINFRNNSAPFRKVSLSDLLAGNVSPEWIENCVVLIGVTANSAKDFVNSDAVPTSNPGLVSGVEVQAHAVSQILSAVLDNRSILKTWPTGWEYFWIVLWGFIGIGLSRLIRIPPLHLIVVLISSTGIFLFGYFLILLGWWIPVIPAGFLYFFNGAILYGFYWYGQSLKLRIEERQHVIQQSYGAIHNGPLQTLAFMLRTIQEEDKSRQTIHEDLQRLDRELRNVYEFMERGVLEPKNQLHLTGNFAVDLSEPLHDLLYQVYGNTVLRPLPCFSSIQIYLTQFKPMAENALSIEQKQEVARFFEEALCNVGRYAKDATRLEIICKQVEDQNMIRVADNGIGLDTKQPLKPNPDPTSGGRGTRQAIAIAKTLSGTFQRTSNNPKGTICELTWPVNPPKRWQFWR